MTKAPVSETAAGSGSADGEASVAKPGKYLTFRLGNEEYGIEILKVQEIIGMMEVTALPRTPDYVRGVINLRGKVIPVIDFRLKFGLPSKEDTEKTCIIVVQVDGGDARQTVTGLVVDEVSEVIDIADSEIDTALEFGTRVDTDFVMGIGKVETKVIILLDMERILSEEDLQIV